jgi:hypothetical protein
MEGAPGSKKGGVSRREALRRISGASLGASAVAYGTSSSNPFTSAPYPGPQQMVNVVERRKSISFVKSQNASYSIEYGNHSKMSTPEVLAGTDALLLELSADLTTRERVIVSIDSVMYDKEKERRPYEKLLETAFAEGKPVYFIDMVDGDTSLAMYLDSHGKEMIKAVEMMGGGAVAGTMLVAGRKENMNPAGGTDRRSVLRNTIAGLVGGWLLTPAVEKVAKVAGDSDGTPDEMSLARGVEKKAASLNEKIHPELRSVVIQGRNELMAQKAEAVAKALSRELGREPRLALEVGADHHGIERSLNRTPEERIAILKGYLGEELSYQSGIVQVKMPKGGTSLDDLEVEFFDENKIMSAFDCEINEIDAVHSNKDK